jgi:hypothetical protein
VSVREITRKLRAWEAGQPLPRFSTIHHAVVPEPQAMILAFVRMAGESRPWGIAWGAVGSEPRIETVPDGRVRDDVGDLCASLAEDLLAHLRVHNWTYDPIERDAEPHELRQMWLPNGQHVAMLHHLSYTYSQTRFGGANQDILRALGRLAGWMFRDTSRRGNQHVVSASQALAEAYVFPAQGARTAHLGYQLAWLTAAGDRDARIAAATEAEGLTISPTMDPSLERDELDGLVARWQQARREGGEVAATAAAIAAILAPELERRWRLTETTYRLLSAGERPVNAGVGALVKEAHDEFWFQHQRLELRQNDPSQGPAFVPHPETDFHGSSAASRYLIHAAADEAYIGHLIHGDDELFQEALEDGHAFHGIVVSVDDRGPKGITTPIWKLRLDPDVPNRLREGGGIVPRGSRGHVAAIVSVGLSPQGIDLELEWTGRKTKPLSCGIGAKPVDPAWIGEQVAFVVSDAAELTRRRSGRVWKAKDGPGAWLTHGRAPAPVEISDDEGDIDLLVDDISQIEEGATA